MKKLPTLAKKIIKLSGEYQFILYLLVFLLAFFIFGWLQLNPGFLDPDSFYHLKISKMISAQGPVFDFPWLQFTVLKDYFIDHHFLYHVLTIPFINLLGDFVGFKFFSALLAA